MWKEDTFNEIAGQLLSHRLGKAIKMMDNFLLSHPGHPATEPFHLYASHYELLKGYWTSGYDDPQRDQLYQDLLHRFYVLMAAMTQHECNRRSSYRSTIRRMALQFRKDWSLTAVKGELENFVSDMALLSLEPENVQAEKSRTLYEQHQRLLCHLFNYMLTSELWHTADAETCMDILLSPTVDSIDQQLIVSSITLAALNLFDIHKFKTLVRVYQQSTDERVRQRALVGWALVADAGKSSIYPEVKDIIALACEDENCCKELAELQMQMVFCMEAEADTRRIQDEIMPDLLKNSHIKITRQGLVDADEDTLEDILHPDAAEQNMEKMEESMKKMADMQQQGADIYFGGFSQMKRFPFFNEAGNWLMPFYPQHPGISTIWNKTRGRKFLHLITKLGAFCDSDKYSFVLAFEMVLDRLPASMLSMIEQGEAVPMPVGGEVAPETQHDPAFIRRIYLQNLYRFFKIYPSRSEFRNPFGTLSEQEFLFFCNPLFCDTDLQGSYVKLASFLLKRKMHKETAKVLACCTAGSKSFQYYMMMGLLASRNVIELTDDLPRVSDCYRQALSLQPDNEKALAGLARACFNEHDYEQSLTCYERLLSLHEGSASHELGRAVCLLNMKRYEEALQKLFQLDYEQPDSMAVKRSLAWALTVNNKFEQAEKIYGQLLNENPVQTVDLLNYGYCLWFQHRHQQAADMFRRLLSGSDAIDIVQEFTQVEAELIRERGISEVEVQLMLDLISTD